MAKENETVADIIAEMRGDANADEYTPDGILGQKLNYIANRLDAAHKREIEAIAAKCCQLGRLAGYGASEIKHQQELVVNAAKLREALVQVKKKIAHLCGNLNAPGSLVASRMEINGIINAALAAPARNCDVGTAEEQAKRLHRFCISQDCVTCPCDRGKADGRCEFAWMQLPYEEGEIK